MKITPALSYPRIQTGTKRRFMRRASVAAAALCAFLLGGYGVTVLVMLQIEPSLVYMPSAPDQEWENKPDPRIEDVSFTTSDGKMHGWYLPAEKPEAVLLLCHGTAGNLSARGQGLPEYSRRYRSSIFVFDYPGYGYSEGKPTEKGCYEAAQAAYDWLRTQHQFRPEQIVIYGESLGGGIAVDLASRNTCGALILVHTFANLPEVAQAQYPWLPVTLLMRNRFDSEAKIGSVKAPLFITHGTADRLIPFEHSMRVYNNAVGPKVHIPREGKDHLDPLNPEMLDRICDFLTTHGPLKK